MKDNLFYRIFGTYIIITLIAMVVVGIYAARQIKGAMMERIEGELSSYARIISLGFSKTEMQDALKTVSNLSNARITLIDAGGTVIADSDEEAARMDNHLNRPEIQEARVRGQGRSVRFSNTLEIDTLYIAFPVREMGDIQGYIRLARPLVEIRQSVWDITLLVLQSFLIVGALSLLIAFIFTSRLVSPIQEMEQFTRRLQDGEEPGTLIIGSTGETGRLARNINYLVGELKDKIRSADEEKGKLEAAFASMADGVLVLDNEGRIEALNQSFKAILGVRGRDIIGRTPLEAFRNIDLENAMDQYRETGLPVAEEITLGRTPDMTLDVSISPIRGLPKDEEKTMMVFHDVTRLKKLEKMRVDFVANVTHEIKTPLTAILGFIETLEQGAISEEETARKFLHTIRKQATRLNRLVDDLLFLSNIELGETRLFFESVTLAGVMESVVTMVDQRVREKGIALTKDIPHELPPLRADRDRLNQILLNILDNAVKFTPEKETISVTARLSDDETHVVVTIADTGIGIPKSEVSRLGERFYRVDKTRSRELGGTGLGLSIVKHLMHAHGGEMEIESQLGAGTAVSLYFPAYRKDAEENPV
jgi:two-component system phosphate regulon sensor histidine kinase PhoR